jgi:hypothetical protein
LSSATRSTGSDCATIPDHWSLVAVWPHREVCPPGLGGSVFDAHEAVLGGRSPLDVVQAINAGADLTLHTPEGATLVHFQLEEPSGLLCVSNGIDVPGTLRADATKPASALSTLAATSIFRVEAAVAPDGTRFDRFGWVRRDVVASLERSALEAATGIVMEAPEQYADFWWSWHGVETRASAAEPWSTRAELLVNSLNVEQAAQIAQVEAAGGPGVGIRFDEETNFPVLPGDRLIGAELASP